MRDPVDNPFVPGFGSTPPALTGRHEILADLELVIERFRRGRYEQPRALTGDRGMGKTALLIELDVWCRERAVWHVRLQATSTGDVTVPLIRDLEALLAKASADGRVGEWLAAASATVTAFAVTWAGARLELAPGQRRGGTGDLATDLGDVLVAVAHAARDHNSVLMVSIDEVQKLAAEPLEALLAAVQHVYLDRAADSIDTLPLAVVVAGLSNTVAVLRERGGTFGERVRELPLGPLREPDVVDALVIPLEQRDITIEPTALHRAVDACGGWPYALQQVGYELWNSGASPTITDEQAEIACQRATEALGRLYDSRLAELPDGELAYLTAVAALPEGQRGAGQVADALERSSSQVATYRSRLITQRSLLRPIAAGQVALTLPGLEQHLRAGNRTARRH